MGPYPSPRDPVQAMIMPRVDDHHTSTDTDQTVVSYCPQQSPIATTVLHPIDTDPDNGGHTKSHHQPVSDSAPEGHSYSAWSAWIVVLGSVCLTMPTYGLMSAFGLFQVYWETHQLADYNGGDSDTAISWISSLLGFLNCFFGLLSGILIDRVSSSPSTRGMILLLVPSSVVYWATFLVLAWCSTYGQYMACMVVAGIASALPSTAAFVVVDHIFEVSPALKHSAAATGVVSTGAPLGGLLVSLMLRALLARTVPNAWAVSMFWLSSVIGAMELLGCILVVWGSQTPLCYRQATIEKDANRPKEQTPDLHEPAQGIPIEIKVVTTGTTTAEKTNHLGSSDKPIPRRCATAQASEARIQAPRPAQAVPWYCNTALWAADTGSLSHFADQGFWLFTICVFVYEFVLYVQWGSLPYFAARTGLGDVFYLQMVYNLGAIPGRTIPSWLAARYGPFNITLAMTALTILTVFVIWVPFGYHSAVALYIVAFFMGVGTGSFVPLAATCLSRLCNGRGFGKWLGTCYAIVSVASLIGSPVSQALLEKTSPRFSVIFQGILLVVSFFFCLLVRRGDMRRRRQPTEPSTV